MKCLTSFILLCSVLLCSVLLGTAAAREHRLPVYLGELTSVRVIDADTAEVHTSMAFNPPLAAGQAASFGDGDYSVRLERTDGKSDWLHFSTGYCNALVVEATISGYDGRRRTSRFPIEDCRAPGEERFSAESVFDGFLVADLRGCGGWAEFDRAAGTLERAAADAGAQASRDGLAAVDGRYAGLLSVRNHSASTDAFADRLPATWTVDTSSRWMTIEVPCDLDKESPRSRLSSVDGGATGLDRPFGGTPRESN